MTSKVLKATGFLSVFLNDTANGLRGRNNTASDMSAKLDKTGRCASSEKPAKKMWDDHGVLFVDYPSSFAHSMWRSQEFSLFAAYSKMMSKPLLDFGCGDGSFASILFEQIDYGADIDEQALDIAGRRGTYKHLISSHIPLPLDECSINTVMANSVLEHVVNLNEALGEIHRILVPGGVLVFTVPLARFADSIAKYFGEKESRRMNMSFYHRNLFDEHKWFELLRRVGFQIKETRYYQPDWFTYLYRIIGTVGIGRLIGQINRKLSNKTRPLIYKAVSNSISNTEQGDNIFVVAQKI